MDCFEKWWKDRYYTLFLCGGRDIELLKPLAWKQGAFFIVVALPSVLLPQIGYDGLAAPYADLGTFGRTAPPDCSERQAVRNRTGKPFDLS